MAGQRWFPVVALLFLGLVAVPARAQQVDPVESAEPALAMRQGDAHEEAQREMIRDLLERAPVQHAARVAGLDIDRAEASLIALHGAELERAATQARLVNEKLGTDRGNADVITISTTTIIIVLLLIILIVVLAN